MKQLFFTVSFLLFSSLTFAGPRSLGQMVKAAEKVLNVPETAVTRASGAGVQVLKSGGQYTVLGNHESGFAIIANDDRFNAVLGYSHSKFDDANMPPALKAWMAAVDEVLTENLDNGVTPVPAVELRSSDYPASVDPLLSTSWDQSAPYNTIVVQKLGDDYPTGCVATAMAQIMKYHSWPMKGSQYHSYRCQPEGSSSSINLIADFENTTYQWENMLDKYDAKQHNYTSEQADAIATLMFQCGVSVDMQYNLDGSGAYTNQAATSLRDYFRYSTKFYTRDIYSKNEWMDIIYSELSDNCPILYSGVTWSGAGHAFVFDGYDADGLVHVNWGWSGSGNGYYDVAILNSPTGRYSEQQQMVIAHGPENSELPYSSEWGICSSVDWVTSTGDNFTTDGKFDLKIIGKSLSFAVSNLMNCSDEKFSGQISLLAQSMDQDSTTMSPIQLTTKNVSNASYRYQYPGNAQDYAGMVSVSSLSDGKYRVYFATKSIEESSWQVVRSNETIVNNYIVTIQGGSISIEEGEPGWSADLGTTTGIVNVEAHGDQVAGNHIYTTDGCCVGTDASKLGKGLYICNGKKFVKE